MCYFEEGSLKMCDVQFIDKAAEDSAPTAWYGATSEMTTKGTGPRPHAKEL